MFTGKCQWQPEEAGRGSHNKSSPPPHRTKCHLFPGWLTQPSPWKEQTFKTLWHVSETLPLSQCCWCSPNWQQRSRRSWLGDVASLVSVTSHPRHGLVSNSSANINSIRREAQVQRVDICCHACVLCVSERMRGCVCWAGGTGWGLIKERGGERALGTGCDPGECVRAAIQKVPRWSCVAPNTSPPDRSQGRVGDKDRKVRTNLLRVIVHGLKKKKKTKIFWSLKCMKNWIVLMRLITLSRIWFKHAGMLVMPHTSLVLADHIGCFRELDRQSWWVLLMQKTAWADSVPITACSQSSCSNAGLHRGP